MYTYMNENKVQLFIKLHLGQIKINGIEYMKQKDVIKVVSAEVSLKFMTVHVEKSI